MNVPLCSLAALFGLGASLPLAAAGYATTFDDITGGFTLSDADGWVTNDPEKEIPVGNFYGQTDVVSIIPGYSTTGSDQWALLGGATGFAPGEPTVNLYRPVDLTGATGASLTVDMAITSSLSPFPNQDTFGWTFQDASLNTLFRVEFDPATAVGGELNVRMYDSLGAELTAAGSGSFDIFYDAIYSMELAVDAFGGVNLALTDSLAVTTNVITGAATGVNPADIGSAAATWKLVSPSASGAEQVNYGSNSLVFNDYALVPEPSSLLLVGLGGLLAFRRRRS